MWWLKQKGRGRTPGLRLCWVRGQLAEASVSARLVLALLEVARPLVRGFLVILGGAASSVGPTGNATNRAGARCKINAYTYACVHL